MKIKIDHVIQYLVLLTGAVFFILSFNLFKESHTGQFLISILFVIFYIVWGAIHHLIEKTFRLKVMVEYILIGAITLFLLKILLIP